MTLKDKSQTKYLSILIPKETFYTLKRQDLFPMSLCPINTRLSLMK